MRGTMSKGNARRFLSSGLKSTVLGQLLGDSVVTLGINVGLGGRLHFSRQDGGSHTVL